MGEEKPAPKRKSRRSTNAVYKVQEAKRQRLAIQNAGEAKAPTKSRKACESDISSDVSTTDGSSPDKSSETDSSDSKAFNVPQTDDQNKVAGERKSYFGDCVRGIGTRIR